MSFLFSHCVTATFRLFQVKYDGERMQLHMDEGGAFKFYSRNGFDFSDDFGRSAGDLDKFSYHAARCLAPHVKSVILDGEICAYNFQVTILLGHKME